MAEKKLAINFNTMAFLKSILVIFLCTYAQWSFAQKPLDNQIFDSDVQTVQLLKNGTEAGYPIISLNGDQLKLSFDVLGNKNEFFQYTIIHCDYHWIPTNMQQSLYINGMMFDNINDFKFSTNTYVKYVHYDLTFPNENIKPTIAGNYIIKVYRNFDENDVLLTRRFMIIKAQTQITGTAKIATLSEFRYTKQEINFSVKYDARSIPNPLQDVNVAILQNNRWDNAIKNLKPLFSSNGVLDYNYFDQILFNGGNEFRFFDTRNLRQYSINIRTKYFDSIYKCLINFDEPRSSKQYFQTLDYNGKRVINNLEGNNPDIDGDYALMQFQLSALSSFLSTAEVYVIGEFTDWKLNPAYKMFFNKNRNRFELETLMKQGRYEYAYAIANKETNQPDETEFEGNHSNTENEYLILVYNRNLQFNYDELVGSQIINSAR
jgi:hypothetical protein